MVLPTLSTTATRAFSEFLKGKEKVETHADALRKRLLDYILDGLRKQHVKSVSKDTLLKIENILEGVVDNTLDSVVREVKHAELQKALNRDFVHVEDYDPSEKISGNTENNIQILEYVPKSEELHFSDHYLPEDREATFWDINKVLSLKESHY